MTRVRVTLAGFPRTVVDDLRARWPRMADPGITPDQFLALLRSLKTQRQAMIDASQLCGGRIVADDGRVAVVYVIHPLESEETRAQKAAEAVRERIREVKRRQRAAWKAART